jgi:hypothetical protein
MLRFANTELLESVAPQRPTRWRHLPAILLVASLLLFAVAMAGPTHDMRIPRNRAVVLLVIDVSQSMCATYISPSRLAAAQDAAKQFAGELTPGINLGLIAYAGTASVLVSPTTNHDATKRAIDTLQVADRTATGEGIFTALQAIATVGAVIGGGDTPPARIVLFSDSLPQTPSCRRCGGSKGRPPATERSARLTVSSMTKTSSAATPARLPRLPTADLKNACFAATGRSLPATTRIMTNPSVLGPPMKVRS